MDTLPDIGAVPVTVRQYRRLPEQVDGLRFELLKGFVYMTPPPSPFHQTLVLRLSIELVRQLGGQAVVLPSPVGVQLSDTSEPEPDVVVIATERKKIVRAKAVVGAPDLVIEVLSTYSRGRDQVTKRNLYERSGVPEYWIIDPGTESALALTLHRRRYRAKHLSRRDSLTSKRFPDVRIRLNALFKPL